MHLSRSFISSSISAALGLILNVSCVGCGIADVEMCQKCRDSIRPRMIRRSLDADPSLKVWAAGLFHGQLAELIKRYKEQGVAQLARPLAELLRSSIVTLLGEVTDVSPGNSAAVFSAPVYSAPVISAPVCAAPVYWVPAPSPRASFVKRGFSPLNLICRKAGIRPSRLLVSSRVRLDQVGLTLAQRRENISHSIRIRPGITVAGLPVVVVDDVVTTGATLVECARVLNDAGAIVLGAACIASTPKNFEIFSKYSDKWDDNSGSAVLA